MIWYLISENTRQIGHFDFSKCVVTVSLVGTSPSFWLFCAALQDEGKRLDCPFGCGHHVTPYSL